MNVIRAEKGCMVVDQFLDFNTFDALNNLANTYDNFTRSTLFWPENIYKGDGVEANGDVLVSKDVYQYTDEEWGCKHETIANGQVIHYTTCFKAPDIIKTLQDKIIDTLTEYEDEIDIKISKGFKSFYSRIYNWKESNIFWHNDGDKLAGITYYINREWKSNWGGEIMFKDGTFYEPKPNRICCIFKGFYHKTNPVIKGAADRMTIQNFIL